MLWVLLRGQSGEIDDPVPCARVSLAPVFPGANASPSTSCCGFFCSVTPIEMLPPVFCLQQMSPNLYCWLVTFPSSCFCGSTFCPSLITSVGFWREGSYRESVITNDWGQSEQGPSLRPNQSPCLSAGECGVRHPHREILISRIRVWLGHGVFKAPQMINVWPRLRTMVSAKCEDSCPKAPLLLSTCIDSELGVSLPVPVKSPAIVLHCYLGCDYWCLVSRSIRNNCFWSFYLPEILWKFWYDHGILSGVMGYCFKICCVSFPWGCGRKRWKVCI